MSAGEIGGRAGFDAGALRATGLKVRGALATVTRPPRHHVAWPSPGRIALAAVLALAVVIATMALLDAWGLASARRLPARVFEAFDGFSDLGKSGWFLWPIGLLLIALAILDTPALPPFARNVLVSFSVRLGFVFTAIALPGLFVTVVKRLIGRARPIAANDNVWAFVPFGWKVEYASLPSGHATTAFAALVAIGAIFPPARALMWIYAVMIALSRVIVTAHHPSDVVAGAIVGTVGALLVRNWFAARRLGFAVRPDGAVQPLPGPSLRRIVKAVAHRLRPD
jgi:undecaprenyl-diphosphatase